MAYTNKKTPFERLHIEVHIIQVLTNITTYFPTFEPFKLIVERRLNDVKVFPTYVHISCF